MMKFLALLALIAGAVARPADVASPVVYSGLLPFPAPVVGAYSLPVYPYAHTALHTGLVYPIAEEYVHDVTGDADDNSAPEAEAYVHDIIGDASDNSSPEAVAYVHDVTGDASDNSAPEALAYVHDPAGDA